MPQRHDQLPSKPESLEKRPVHGILAVGDRPTVMASYLARLLGLPGHPPEAARAARDKRLTRERLKAGGLLAPAFISVAAGATAAPLNPVYRAEEFEFYLTDLRAKALLVSANDDTAARAVAKRLNVPIIELHAAAGGPAGNFSLEAGEGARTATSSTGPAVSDDIALILHTSGTTSRPKIVPLTQRNVCASASNVRDDGSGR